MDANKTYGGKVWRQLHKNAASNIAQIRGQHPTNQQLYGHLPPITKTIQVRRTRYAEHCWRSRDELKVTYSCEPLHKDEQRQDEQLEPIYNSSVEIQDVALKTYRERWTIETSGRNGSGRSVLVVWHDDDDDDDNDECEQTKFSSVRLMLWLILQLILFSFFFFFVLWKPLRSCPQRQHSTHENEELEASSSAYILLTFDMCTSYERVVVILALYRWLDFDIWLKAFDVHEYYYRILGRNISEKAGFVGGCSRFVVKRSHHQWPEEGNKFKKYLQATSLFFPYVSIKMFFLIFFIHLFLFLFHFF